MRTIIAAFLVVSAVFFGCLQTNGPQPVLVGNDSDIHGCKGSAGYSWCEAKQKCIRVWEENCTANLSCACPKGYVQEGDVCNPNCYYSTPRCLAPSFKCSQGNAGMANPASVNCIGNGYNLTIRTDSEGGQYGVCSKPGYTECEEWAFFRDNCTIVPLGPNVSANATGREPRAEGQFCGGIAAIPCQEGLHCRLNGTYPDAGGACIKDCGCTLMTNGTAMGCFGCAYVKETGSFNCTSAPEGWQQYEKKPGAIGIPYACYCADFGETHVTVNGVNTTYAAHGGCGLAQ